MTVTTDDRGHDASTATVIAKITKMIDKRYKTTPHFEGFSEK
jgi:hypothetical protein